MLRHLFRTTAVLRMRAAACIVAATALIACSPGGPSAENPGDSLALLYSFDARSGNVVRDFSGRGNHGTVFGATWTEGRFGRALTFDGVDDYVQAVGNYPFSDANGLTVEAWVKLAGSRSFSNIVASRNCCDFRMLISPALHPFYNPGAYVDVEVKTRTLEVGRWTHYALVVAGGQRARVLFDGQVVSDTKDGVPRSIPSLYEALLIGGNPEVPDFTVNGIIDELRVYTRALSDEEVRADMTSSTGAVLVRRAAALVGRLESQGGNAAAARQKLQQSQEALKQAADESAQALAYEVGALVGTEQARRALRDGVAPDAGTVLLSTLLGIFAFGTVVAMVLIWGAWKAAS